MVSLPLVLEGLPPAESFEVDDEVEFDELLPLESLRIRRSPRPVLAVPVVLPAVPVPFIELVRPVPVVLMAPVLPGAVALEVPVDVVPGLAAVFAVELEVEPVPVCANAAAEAAPMAITEAIARVR